MSGFEREAARLDPTPDPAWLAEVAVEAARHSGAPEEMLDVYLQLIADAALHGRRPDPSELVAVRELGRQAAAHDVSARRMVNLYLSAAARLWSSVPATVRTRDRDAVSAAAEAVLIAVTDAVAALVDGHYAQGRRMIRREEAARREFINDLLRGDADVARLAERAEPFGLQLGHAHQVALAVPLGQLPDRFQFAAALERSIAGRYGGRGVLVATRENHFIVIAPAAEGLAASLAEVVRGAVVAARKSPGWRFADGRAHPGAYGIARSYEEAREALRMARLLSLNADVVHARGMLIYQVVGRDQAAIADLIDTVLGPLTQARGGPEQLLYTLNGYFEAGEVATEAARRMHLSVRTISYRLARVAELTGYNIADPTDRFTLHVAVLGARLLDWPRQAFRTVDA